MADTRGPEFPVKVITGVRVRMRDGVDLNVRITRPDAEGRFPAIVEYNPYRRLGAALPDYRDEYPPVVPYLAERGYVIVQFDVRGTGSSAGFTTDNYSDEERQDGYDMVEWAASQPWCTGAVGMFGKSYGANVQWQVAVQDPPHLRTIVIRSGGNDLYADTVYPGGARRPWRFESFAPMMNAFNFSPPDVRLVGDRWAAMWAERLEKSEPWSLASFRHDTFDDYWQAKNISQALERVKCPVFLVEGWADWYAQPELLAFRRLKVPRKVLIGPWGHYYAEEKGAFPGPRIDARREYLRWFDHWLKGIDTGIMDEPPVTVFLRDWAQPSLLCLEDAGTWRQEASWPPEHAASRPFHFGPSGRLSTDPAAETGADTYAFRASVGLTSGRVGLGSTSPWGMPLDQRLDDAYSQLYTTAPLDADLTLMGDAEAVLFVSSTADTAYFHVRLCDVAPDGVSRLISHGGLLATHRTSHAAPEPLVPGEVYEIRIPMRDVAYVLRKGHRLRVAVASADFQNAWPTGKNAENTIHWGGAHASRIDLPVASADAARLPAPDFADSPHPLPRAGEVPKPTYALHLDLVNDTVTCELASDAGAVRNRSLYTVSNRDPAQAVIDSRAGYSPAHPSLKIDVQATCQTASDANQFTHASEVVIRINGNDYFRKSWLDSRPRGYS